MKISSVSLLEASIVLSNRLTEGSLSSLDAWVEAAGIRIEPFTAAQAHIARMAYVRYGKGRHSAGLNFGDCASYALAVEHGEELLFTGEDFGQSDIAKAAS